MLRRDETPTPFRRGINEQLTITHRGQKFTRLRGPFLLQYRQRALKVQSSFCGDVVGRMFGRPEHCVQKTVAGVLRSRQPQPKRLQANMAQYFTIFP